MEVILMDLKERMRLGCTGFIGIEILWNFGEIVLAIMDHEWWISLAIVVNSLVMIMTFFFLNEEKPFDFVMVNEEDWNIMFQPEMEEEFL